MLADAIAHMSRQSGLVTRTQALDAGLSPNVIQHLTRSGTWVRVRRGVYADCEVWDALDQWVGRPRLLARAAVLTMARAWVLSHDSAAHELGLDILTPEDPFVHVSRAGFTGAWTEYGVKHHLARFDAGQVVVVDGRRVLDLARTAVDIARERPEPHGLAACDSALRMGVPRERLWDAVGAMNSWPYVTRVREAIASADAGAATVAESQGRHLVHELGIGQPDTQFPVQLGDRVVFCDLRVGNHIFEVDGRIKYRPADRGGVADRPIEDVVWEEKRRHRLLAAEGLGVSRILAEDFHGEKRTAARLRLRAEYQVSLTRFGPELPERLARNAERIRARRGA